MPAVLAVQAASKATHRASVHSAVSARQPSAGRSKTHIVELQCSKWILSLALQHLRGLQVCRGSKGCGLVDVEALSYGAIPSLSFRNEPYNSLT